MHTILRYAGKHEILCVISEYLILSKSKNLTNKLSKNMVKVIWKKHLFTSDSFVNPFK